MVKTHRPIIENTHPRSGNSARLASSIAALFGQQLVLTRRLSTVRFRSRGTAPSESWFAPAPNDQQLQETGTRPHSPLTSHAALTSHAPRACPGHTRAFSPSGMYYMPCVAKRALMVQQALLRDLTCDVQLWQYFRNF
jgi:hypothetical protein